MSRSDPETYLAEAKGVLTWGDVARRARISEKTLKKIRRGERVSPDKIAAVENVLGLPRGALMAVCRGEQPGPAGGRSGGERVELVDAPGGGQMWRLTRVVGGETLEFTLTARPWVTADLAERELTRVADQMEAAAILHGRAR
ncbi:MAG: helix-turn-helix transcriptional regulator [Limnochordales bacterium]